MKVHSYFSSGFPEIVYKRSLVIELEKAGLQYASEVEKDINYWGVHIGKRRLDLIVEDTISVELKAVSEVGKKDYNQIINYLKIFGFEVGLLLNFGAESLQYKRFIRTKKAP